VCFFFCESEGPERARATLCVCVCVSVSVSICIICSTMYICFVPNFVAAKHAERERERERARLLVYVCVFCLLFIVYNFLRTMYQ
jgi:hypothetical protein